MLTSRLFGIGILVVVLLSVLQFSDGCFSSGTCGGGGFSIPICLPPPQLLPPTCGGGCGTGYQCGQYGCYRERAYSRARVHGSKSAVRSQSRLFGKERFRALSSRIQEEEDSRSNNPNMMFMQCCENRGLPDACLQKCTFNSYTKDALLNMYFRTDECPIEAAAEIQYCAAQGQDHRECCAMNGVHTTLAGEKCLIFCDQRPGNVTVLDMSYISCYERFDEIKTCFWQVKYRRQYTRKTSALHSLNQGKCIEAKRFSCQYSGTFKPISGRIRMKRYE